MSAVLSPRISVYLCVLCVKYIGANDLTQSPQRYTEIRRETRIANEPIFRAKPLKLLNADLANACEQAFGRDRLGKERVHLLGLGILRIEPTQEDYG
jgi:hypothetical protein